MSKAISLKVNEEIFKETEAIIKKLHQPRNNYINQALDYYNRCMRRQLLKSQFVRESAAVYGESLKTSQEFEDLENGLE